MMSIPGYTLLDAIRSTGSNTLFRAVRETDSLRGIIKMPMASSPRERERYRQEFAILQRLQGVRGVHRAHTCELLLDRPVLFLEEVEGTPLSELVGQPLDLPRFLELAISLTSILVDLHHHGVIHKDLKPSNIIITPSEEARIIDFGTAILQRVEHVDAASPSQIEGTLAYMSPEQTGRMNRAVDYRTDFYSLGVTFYEMLTGARPFHGRDALEWFHAHLAQSPRPPHELVPAIPRAVSAVVMKLLAKVAEERYQGAEGLRADLERCREGLRRGGLEVFPLGAHDTPSRFQLPQRLYGREAQAASLLQGFERVLQSGKPELVLVSGYSGIGKSALIHELHRPVVEHRGLFLSGKFEQFQRDIPYATLARAIRGLVQQLLGGTDEELARWRERLRSAWGGDGQVLVDLIPQLELIAGRQPELQQLPTAEARHRFNRVFRQFLGVFATAEHPLAVFLDDLQWADLASLQLLQHLLSQADTPPVLWLGAYRDNEVSPSHPLVAMEAAVRKAGARVTDLRLEPLGLAQVQRLVADSLPGADTEIVEPLSVRVHEKTGGNPFFLIQLLVTLNQDGLLVRGPAGGWRWDAEGVRARGYSDNVVDFLLGRLRQLPFGMQHLLRLAACVGHTFPLPVLTTLCGGGAQEEVELESVLQEGLLVRSGPEHYRFLHDRIHQAALALIPQEERPAIHLRIGRLLLERLSPEELREQLFDVVSQLNAGAGLLQEPSERLHAARLNAEAGRKARASMAHQSAITYLEAAFALIPGDPWATDYPLTFQLRLAQANCELMSGNTAGARRLVEELQRRARTRPDLSDAYCLKSDLHLIAGEIPLAVECLLEYLAREGMPMSARPLWGEVVAAHGEVWALLGERRIESLVELPLMTDPDMKALMRVLGALTSPSYYTDNNLFILNLCRLVSLSLRHGNTDVTAFANAWFGLATGYFFKRYKEGQAFGELALALLERHDFAAYRGKVLFILGMLNTWTQPLTGSLELARAAFRQTLQTGDLAVACHCSYHAVMDRLALGHGLEEVYQETVACCDFVSRVGYLEVRESTLVAQRYVQQLRGLSSSFDTMNGEGFDEAVFEARLTADSSSTRRCRYWVLKLQSRFMCGAYEQALEAASRAAETLWSSSGLLLLLDYHLYRALSLAAHFENAVPEVQRVYLEALRRHHRQLQEWASHCPQNFLAPERMVAAELARLLGRSEEATCAYEEAIDAARENGFIQHVALANELAARFWRTRRASTIFKAFASAAREAYLRWGALGKVLQLDTGWPDLVVPGSSPEGLTTHTDSTRVDALTLVKVQQAISSEIVMERLAATLMRVAIENAGAQRGALLLEQRDGALTVVATSGDAPDGAQALPGSLISYVKRTREHVLIGDASKPHPFSSDAYLERGGARSVLCLPLLRQERFHGVLYLENSLAPDAFTPGRLSLLEHLATQAAISLEHARLYGEVQHAEAALRRANDELERRVEERTHELRQTQARLVDTAREVGMTEVASNVLHNVGNVLTSVVINFEMLSGILHSSRVEGVKKAAAMLEEHRGELVDFLARDERGRQLPDYLKALADQLLYERTLLGDGLEVMGQHIEHIRAIVQDQRLYATRALLIEECDLAQLIDDSLRILQASLHRHGVSVTRELPSLPGVRVDKHKVLQILINLVGNAKNALDSMPEGRRNLRMRLRREGEWVRIQVEDNGSGIAPEVRKKLFTHGFTTRKEGHGFGLHWSALAAQQLGGSLTLESQGPGKGATATLLLPLAQGPGAPSESPEPVT